MNDFKQLNIEQQEALDSQALLLYDLEFEELNFDLKCSVFDSLFSLSTEAYQDVYNEVEQ